jgi:hypothetical protein
LRPSRRRGVATIDEISKKLDAMKETSIEQSVEIRAHEARVRVLEAAGRVTQPITRP